MSAILLSALPYLPMSNQLISRVETITPVLAEELGFEWRKGSDSWLRYENLSEDGCDWGIIASEYGFDGWWQIMFRPRDSRLRNEVCCKYLHQLESIPALHGVELIKE